MNQCFFFSSTSDNLLDENLFFFGRESFDLSVAAQLNWRLVVIGLIFRCFLSAAFLSLDLDSFSRCVPFCSLV